MTLDAPPIPPRCQLHHEDILEYPRDVKLYRVVMRQEQNKLATYAVQLNHKFLFFFDRWIDVGPCGCESHKEAMVWIAKTITPKIIVENKVIWDGTTDARFLPDAEGNKKEIKMLPSNRHKEIADYITAFVTNMNPPSLNESKEAYLGAFSNTMLMWFEEYNTRVALNGRSQQILDDVKCKFNVRLNIEERLAKLEATVFQNKNYGSVDLPHQRNLQDALQKEFGKKTTWVESPNGGYDIHKTYVPKYHVGDILDLNHEWGKVTKKIVAVRSPFPTTDLPCYHFDDGTFMPCLAVDEDKHSIYKVNPVVEKKEYIPKYKVGDRITFWGETVHSVICSFNIRTIFYRNSPSNGEAILHYLINDIPFRCEWLDSDEMVTKA